MIQKQKHKSVVFPNNLWKANKTDITLHVASNSKIKGLAKFSQYGCTHFMFQANINVHTNDSISVKMVGMGNDSVG